MKGLLSWWGGGIFGGSRLEIKAALASEAITWFVVLSGESGGWFKSFLILVFLAETQVKN